jgi:hypothetical protein
MITARGMKASRPCPQGFSLWIERQDPHWHPRRCQLAPRQRRRPQLGAAAIVRGARPAARLEQGANAAHPSHGSPLRRASGPTDRTNVRDYGHGQPRNSQCHGSGRVPFGSAQSGCTYRKVVEFCLSHW